MQLLTRENISLRERTMWRMLYETAARPAGKGPPKGVVNVIFTVTCDSPDRIVGTGPVSVI